MIKAACLHRNESVKDSWTRCYSDAPVAPAKMVAVAQAQVD